MYEKYRINVSFWNVSKYLYGKSELLRIIAAEIVIYDYFRWLFCRFDYRGVGESSGDISKVLPSMWIEDILTVLDTLTDPAEPQVLVGSSMGAFLMLHAAVKRPERVQGLVGINTPLISDVKMVVKDLSRKVLTFLKLQFWLIN